MNFNLKDVEKNPSFLFHIYLDLPRSSRGRGAPSPTTSAPSPPPSTPSPFPSPATPTRSGAPSSSSSTLIPSPSPSSSPPPQRPRTRRPRRRRPVRRRPRLQKVEPRLRPQKWGQTLTQSRKVMPLLRPRKRNVRQEPLMQRPRRPRAQKARQELLPITQLSTTRLLIQAVWLCPPQPNCPSNSGRGLGIFRHGS